MAGNRIKGITVEIGGDTTKLQTALKGVNTEIRNTQSQLSDVEKLLKLDPGNTELIAQKHRLLAQAVSETREKLQAVGDKVSGVGQKLLPVTGVVTGLGTAAVKTAADFDSAMSKVAAVSGAAGSEEDKKWHTSKYLVEDEDFTIHQTNARLLSLEEYGGVYGVAADTVRQWIRRGKIRSAVKLGSEWRIPEIAEVGGRGYEIGTYSWSIELPDPPAEIPDINDFDEISTHPSKEKGEWYAMLHAKNGQSSGRAMTSKMKEKLELYLISQPLVECVNNFIGEVNQKGGIDDECF